MKCCDFRAWEEKKGHGSFFLGGGARALFDNLMTLSNERSFQCFLRNTLFSELINLVVDATVGALELDR